MAELTQVRVDVDSVVCCDLSDGLAISPNQTTPNDPAHFTPNLNRKQTDPSSVLHRRVEDLVDVFPDEARASLAQMAAATASSSSTTGGGGGGGGGLVSSGGGGAGGSKQDVRYEVPLLAGGRRGRVVKATFRCGVQGVAWGLLGGLGQMNRHGRDAFGRSLTTPPSYQHPNESSHHRHHRTHTPTASWRTTWRRWPSRASSSSAPTPPSRPTRRPCTTW